MDLKVPNQVFPYWIILLVAFDVLALGGLSVWAFFLIRSLERRKNENNDAEIEKILLDDLK